MTDTRLAELGPFFAVEFHDADEAPVWPWVSLTSAINDPDVIDARMHRVRAALAAGAGRESDGVELRVAASVMHLGMVARLIAPVVGAGALGIDPIGLDAGALWWQDTLGGPFPLSVAHVPSASREPLVAPPSLGVVDEVGAVCVNRYGLSARVVGGNVASAANSAARMIALSRPDLAARAKAAADEVLRRPHIEDGKLRAGDGFRRRSCCLIYRIAGDRAAACGDCVLLS
ncbi:MULTISPECIES: (2Fe-2S)-binding protein [unclassified Gordonia (in: high G+C Gram-positive bacteria)]